MSPARRVGNAALAWRLVVAVVVALAGVTSASPAFAQAELQQAYKREFAFLEAEKNALTQRIAEAEASGREKVEAAKAEIDSLQGQVLALSLEAERMEELLLDTERAADVAGEGDDVVDSLLSQAGVALSQGGIKMPEAKEGDTSATLTQLSFAFDQAIGLLQRYGSVRKEQGDFFDVQGNQVSGTIVKLGNVASYGIAGDAVGALAPAGSHRLKVWPEPAATSTARALAAGSPPDTLHLYIYDSLEKNMEKRAERTWVEEVESGGVIGWVIVGGGVLALFMVLVRIVLLWRAASNTDVLVARLLPLVQEGNIERALEMCSGAKNAAGRVLKATLKNIRRDRAELEDIITESILHEQPHIDRFGSAIIVVAAVSPLLGLLGTVTGMIATFDIITEFGTGNPKLLSGGISIALVTTELGLIVAIPSLLLGNLLSGWAESIKDDMDKAALRVTNVASGVRLHVPGSSPGQVISIPPATAATSPAS